LQRDGLVSVEGGGQGGFVELSLTAKGRKQIEKLAPAWESAQQTAVQVLGEERWSAVLADLDKVASALKN
jgi:DNA-binding MarR family transcriptional regulator